MKKEVKLEELQKFAITAEMLEFASEELIYCWETWILKNPKASNKEILTITNFIKHSQKYIKDHLEAERGFGTYKRAKKEYNEIVHNKKATSSE